MTGKVERIYIAPEHGAAVQQINEAVLEQGKGIVGDRYFGLDHEPDKPEPHITLIAEEELAQFLAEHDADLDYGDFRRNIITLGINLNELVEKEFTVGGLRLRGSELCEPCATLARTVHQKILPGLVHKAGIRAAILESGTIHPGDDISSA